MDYDVIVIGSGFGGSVAALRLAEKGYRVIVLEAGRRYAEEDFPRSWTDLRRFLWAPALGFHGIQRVHRLRDVLVLGGAGVGGGSLNYGNTLITPESDAFYNDPTWAHLADWRAELAPFYALASQMLGAVPNPTRTPSDEALQEAAVALGVPATHRPLPVGVFFGRDGTRESGITVPDPYFRGAGPDRTGCTECGSCMTGCPVGAKNTLVKNYLHLAERLGVRIAPDTTVTAVRPRTPELGGIGHGYAVETVRTGPPTPWRARRTYVAPQVVFAAGTWGTQQLLHRMKVDGLLPHLSDRLGMLTRTNSEALVGAEAWLRAGRDFTSGVAITSRVRLDEDTTAEPCRYGPGRNFMAPLANLLVDGDGLRGWAREARRHPQWLLSHIAGQHRWSQRSVIALVMQSLDNSLTVFPRRRWWGTTLSTRQGHGAPNPTWLPQANELARALAAEIDGFPMGTIGGIADVPLTAHFLGGCTIGGGPTTGVVDMYHRVFGHPGLHIVDGSTVSANLGVNPALTITAQAERATSLWPQNGEPDRRPPLEGVRGSAGRQTRRHADRTTRRTVTG